MKTHDRDAFVTLLQALIAGWDSNRAALVITKEEPNRLIELQVLIEKVEMFLDDEFGAGI